MSFCALSEAKGMDIKRMIELPIFSDEEWYLFQVKKLFLHGNVKEDNIDKNFKESANVNNLLMQLNKVVDSNDLTEVTLGNTIIEKLAVAPYPVLRKIYNKIRPNYKTIFHKKTTSNKNDFMRDEWKPFCKAYDKLVKHKLNLQIIEKYGIKCCPYCNENYIFNRNNNSSAQLDHFYPKEKFPLFAVSLYNLVPSCPACNHIKHEKQISISPHDHSQNFSNMRISYTPKHYSMLQDYHEMEIYFKYKQGNQVFKTNMNQNIEVFKLKEAYQNHKDYVHEILVKAMIYNETSLNKILKLFPNMHLTKEDMLRIIFGNYITKDKLLKRPLSKLTMDLLIELHII